MGNNTYRVTCYYHSDQIVWTGGSASDQEYHRSFQHGCPKCVVEDNEKRRKEAEAEAYRKAQIERENRIRMEKDRIKKEIDEEEEEKKKRREEILKKLNNKEPPEINFAGDLKDILKELQNQNDHDPYKDMEDILESPVIKTLKNAVESNAAAGDAIIQSSDKIQAKLINSLKDKSIHNAVITIVDKFKKEGKAMVDMKDSFALEYKKVIVQFDGGLMRVREAKGKDSLFKRERIKKALEAMASFVDKMEKQVEVMRMALKNRLRDCEKLIKIMQTQDITKGVRDLKLLTHLEEIIRVTEPYQIEELMTTESSRWTLGGCIVAGAQVGQCVGLALVPLDPVCYIAAFAAGAIIGAIVSLFSPKDIINNVIDAGEKQVTASKELKVNEEEWMDTISELVKNVNEEIEKDVIVKEQMNRNEEEKKKLEVEEGELTKSMRDLKELDNQLGHFKERFQKLQENSDSLADEELSNLEVFWNELKQKFEIFKQSSGVNG